MSFFCIMLQQRFTFISDPTHEYPNNTNTKFKVRLPLPLQLEGQWEASLWSLSVPDQELENKIVFKDTSTILFETHFSLYKLTGWDSTAGKYDTLTLLDKTKTFTVQDVMNESTPAQTGVEFWQNCVRKFDQAVTEEARSTLASASSLVPVAVPEEWKPTFKWDGEELTLQAVSENSVVTDGVVRVPYSWFAVEENLAKSFGFLKVNKTTNAKELGDNVTGRYPLYDEKGTSISSAILTSNPGLKGPTRAAQETPDVDQTGREVDHVKFANGRVYFSRALEWTFRRLNESFDKLHNGKEVVMVYADLVQSTVVGNGRFPLLRKLSVDRKGSGRVTVEPFHREWVPLQTNWIETVEFQLSTPGGELTHLSPGKTLITVGLQRRV